MSTYILLAKQEPRHPFGRGALVQIEVRGASTKEDALNMFVNEPNSWTSAGLEATNYEVLAIATAGRGVYLFSPVIKEGYSVQTGKVFRL